MRWATAAAAAFVVLNEVHLLPGCFSYFPFQLRSLSDPNSKQTSEPTACYPTRFINLLLKFLLAESILVLCAAFFYFLTFFFYLRRLEIQSGSAWRNKNVNECLTFGLFLRGSWIARLPRILLLNRASSLLSKYRRRITFSSYKVTIDKTSVIYSRK